MKKGVKQIMDSIEVDRNDLREYLEECARDHIQNDIDNQIDWLSTVGETLSDLNSEEWNEALSYKLKRVIEQ